MALQEKVILLKCKKSCCAVYEYKNMNMHKKNLFLNQDIGQKWPLHIMIKNK